MINLQNLINGTEFFRLTDLVLVVNIIIAIVVAVGEYRRRKAQNKADEGGAISSIATAAATVSNSSLSLLAAKDIELHEMEEDNKVLEAKIKAYQILLKNHGIPDIPFDTGPLRRTIRENNPKK